MKNLFAVLFLIPFIGFAQPFDISSKTFDFSSVNYLQEDSLKMTLTNTTGYDISVIGIDLLTIYDAKPFYVKDSIFTMTVGNTHDVWIYFKPEQNILHEMVAVVKTDFRGDYLVNLVGEGRFSNSYYSASFNKREQDLKNSLKTITGQGYTSMSYNVARDNMYGSIDNVNGDVECVYTGRTATFNTRPGANNNSFNCEHTFPQGFFNSGSPMRSDIHHLFPTDVNSNSQRGNLQFGVVIGNPSWSEGGSKKGNGVFEPRDAQKGQVARALFYFVVRYEDYSNHVQGQEAILRTWFDQYPPIAKDIDRNNDIAALQNNRNPFVDYPQLLKRITKIAGNSTAVKVKGLYVSRNTVDMTGKTDSTLYTISVMNTGNDIVNLTNFRISNTTNFDFTNAQSDRALLPGEGFEITLRVTPTIVASVNEVLNFDTDVAGMATVDVNLVGGWNTLSTSKLKENTDQLSVYPNPASSNVTIGWEGKSSFNLEVYNAIGQVVFSTNGNGQVTLDVSGYKKGAFIIKTSNDSAFAQTTLLIK